MRRATVVVLAACGASPPAAAPPPPSANPTPATEVIDKLVAKNVEPGTYLACIDKRDCHPIAIDDTPARQKLTIVTEP